MKLSNTTLLFTALATPALFAFTLPATKVSFAPAEGLSLTKTFSGTIEMTLDDMSVAINGAPPPVEMDMDMSMTMENSFTVTDEYVAMAEGRPAKLARTYDELGNTSNMSMSMEVMGQSQDEDMSTDASSELEGMTVHFTLDGESGEYKASFPEEGDADEELLDGLEENMDLRSLLPEGEVSEGDSWTIDPDTLQSILSPGGDLKLVPDEEGDGGGGMMGMGNMGDSTGDMSDWLSDTIEGESTATFTGMREVDGAQLAVIELKLQISTAVDMTDQILEAMDETELPEGAEMDFDHLDIEFEFEGEGTMLWNVAGGHFASFELSGQMSLLTDTGMAMNMGGQEMSIENTVEMSGTMNYSATAE